MPIPWVVPAVEAGLGIATGMGAYNRLHQWRHQQYKSGAPPAVSTATSANMPRRSYTKTMTKKRKRTSRRPFRRRIRRVTAMFPRFKLVKFRVVSTFSHTDANGALVTKHIMANSLYDPHGAISANLPLGLDQWAAQYGKYTVVKSQHFVKAHNVTSTGAIVFGLTLRQPGEVSDLTSAEHYLEAPMTRSKMLSPDVDHAAIGIGYSAKKYWRVRKFMDHENLHAAFSTTPASPSRMAYVDLWTSNVIGGDGTYTVEGHLTSEYTVLLFDPITPSRSTA